MDYKYLRSAWRIAYEYLITWRNINMDRSEFIASSYSWRCNGRRPHAERKIFTTYNLVSLTASYSVSLNDDSYERPPGRTAGAYAPLKVYRGRAINIQLCGKAELNERIEGGRDFVPCWCVTTSLCYSQKYLPGCVQTWPVYTTA